MFSLDELRRAEAVVRAALPPTPAIAWPLIGRRLGAEAVVKHENHNPTGAFKVRGGLTFVDALKRRDPEAKGLVSATRGNHGQSLAFAGARAGLRGAHLRSARQFGREERGDAGARRRTGRARRRLPGGARGGDARRRRQRARRRAGLPSRPRLRRRDLRAGAADGASRPRRALRPDRPGLGHLRLHRGARRARPEDRDRRRAGERRAGLRAVLRRRPRHRRPTPATRLADGVATRAPDEQALADHSRAARRASCWSTTTRSPRRSAPIGPTRTISPKGPARRRSPPRCKERSRAGRQETSGSFCRAATSISTCSSAGSAPPYAAQPTP